MNHQFAPSYPNSAEMDGNVDMQQVCRWINDLSYASRRGIALHEICRRRHRIPELGVMLWHSVGTVAALLQEVLSIYDNLNPPNDLSGHQSNRVCNAILLLQSIAACDETQREFLDAHIPIWIYPFLHNSSKHFEYVRMTTLGVLGTLVRKDNAEVINYLLTTEIIPLCLNIMDSGSELSKTVSTYILCRILMDKQGLDYVCQTYERFSHVASILGKLVLVLAREMSSRLLTHVIRCYHRLSDNPRAREALRQCLPDQLRDDTFAAILLEDREMREVLQSLLQNIENAVPQPSNGLNF